MGPLCQEPTVKHLFPAKFLLTVVDKVECLGVEVSHMFDSTIRIG